MELLLVVVAVLAFALAVVRWGADSTEGVNSPEWNHRVRWGGIL